MEREIRTIVVLWIVVEWLRVTVCVGETVDFIVDLIDVEAVEVGVAGGNAVVKLFSFVQSFFNQFGILLILEFPSQYLIKSGASLS